MRAAERGRFEQKALLRGPAAEQGFQLCPASREAQAGRAAMQRQAMQRAVAVKLRSVRRQLTCIGKPQIVPFRPHRTAQRQRPRAALPEAQHEPPPRPERPGIAAAQLRQAEARRQALPALAAPDGVQCLRMQHEQLLPGQGLRRPVPRGKQVRSGPVHRSDAAQRLSRQNGVDHRTHLLPAYAQHFDSAIRA